VSRDEISAALVTIEKATGIDWAYDLLDDVCERHALPDAWMVLHPESSAVQIFGRGRHPVPPDRVAVLANCTSGIFDTNSISSAAACDGAAAGIDSETGTVLGALCDAKYNALLARMTAGVDPVTGLLHREAIDAALARRAACAARYGWSSTVVVLSTRGDAPASQRWRALTAALRGVIRIGDEAGAVATGTALVILGNVGSDEVRPFVARVRAALSATGSDIADLYVATATMPRESVNPAELRRLALERLVETGAEAPCTDRSTLELAVRSVPGVVWVAWATAEPAPVVTVGAWSASTEENLAEQVTSVVHEHLPDASVSIVDVGEEVHGISAVGALPAPGTVRSGRSNGYTLGATGASASPIHGLAGDAPTADEPAPLIAAVAPGAHEREGISGAPRVSLLGASFDAERGSTEVTVELGAVRGTGRAPAGALIGGAQATLDALHALGKDVPFYLVSAERPPGIPGEPVVVVLAARHGGTKRPLGGTERIGVSGGDSDLDAASRATLSALNRFLSRTMPTA
jgi:hypothetical protein